MSLIKKITLYTVVLLGCIEGPQSRAMTLQNSAAVPCKSACLPALFCMTMLVGMGRVVFNHGFSEGLWEGNEFDIVDPATQNLDSWRSEEGLNELHDRLFVDEHMIYSEVDYRSNIEEENSTKIAIPNAFNRIDRSHHPYLRPLKEQEGKRKNLEKKGEKDTLDAQPDIKFYKELTDTLLSSPDESTIQKAIRLLEARNKQHSVLVNASTHDIWIETLQQELRSEGAPLLGKYRIAELKKSVGGNDREFVVLLIREAAANYLDISSPPPLESVFEKESQAWMEKRLNLIEQRIRKQLTNAEVKIGLRSILNQMNEMHRRRMKDFTFKNVPVLGTVTFNIETFVEDLVKAIFDLVKETVDRAITFFEDLYDLVNDIIETAKKIISACKRCKKLEDRIFVNVFREFFKVSIIIFFSTLCCCIFCCSGSRDGSGCALVCTLCVKNGRSATCKIGACAAAALAAFGPATNNATCKKCCGICRYTGKCCLCLFLPIALIFDCFAAPNYHLECFGKYLNKLKNKTASAVYCCCSPILGLKKAETAEGQADAIGKCLDKTGIAICYASFYVLYILGGGFLLLQYFSKSDIEFELFDELVETIVGEG